MVCSGKSVLCGWVEHPGGGEAAATLFLVGCEEVPGGTAWTEESVRKIMDIQR